MIITKCPLRVSLVGGSTDTKSFLNKYGRGSVISFTPDLYTYVFIHHNNQNKYIINYSKKEEVENIDSIENELIRYCFQYFNTPKCTLTLNTSIASTGSGLASSSSFIISIVKAICIFQNLDYTNKKICDISFEIEQKINPLAGYQDVYGCGVGNFKRIDFLSDDQEVYKFLDLSFITKKYDMYLLNTCVTRKSTNILKTLVVDKSLELLQVVDDLEECIIMKREDDFLNIINRGWEIKKKTSAQILNNQELLDMEQLLTTEASIRALKLCGAGGGGYFLLFVLKEQEAPFMAFYEHNFEDKPIVKIKIDNNGPIGVTI